MKHTSQIVIAVAAAMVFTAAAVPAQPFGGPGMMRGMSPGAAAAAGDHGPMGGPAAMLTKQDAGSAADMGLVHDLLTNHTKIKRTVTRLPDGIRTVTESDDPQVAQAIKAHVASMSERLKDGREFNIFSATLASLGEQARAKTARSQADKNSLQAAELRYPYAAALGRDASSATT